MTIDIKFSLDATDLEYFRGVMNRAQDEAGNASEQDIICQARKVLDGTTPVNPPLFVRESLQRLATMIAMLEDAEWPLEGQDRIDVVSALAYFYNPADLIADDVPVLGLIDDAIMIELVAREIHPQIDAYNEFCAYRSREAQERGAGVSREEWLAAKQKELMKRMHERLGRINRPSSSTRLTRFSFLR